MPSSNIQQVERQLRHFEQRGTSLAPLMAEIANLLQVSVEDAFDNEKNPFDNKKWATLKDSTLAKKKGKPLYESGRMQDSLHVFSNATQAVVGLPATAKGYNYPAVHQFGTEDGKVTARPFLPINANGDISDALHHDIINLIEAHFLG